MVPFLINLSEIISSIQVQHQLIHVNYYCLIRRVHMLATQKNNDVIDQIKKLIGRISNLNETKYNFFEYLIKTQQMVADHSKNMKQDIEKFEDQIIKKSFYSIGKCQGMKKVVYIEKLLCTIFQNFAKLNLVEIKKIDIVTGKQEEKLKKKSETFIKAVEQYRSSEAGYNKVYGVYQGNCDKLDEMMGRFKSFQDPINFYNLNRTADFSKSLDKTYFESENKEVTLQSSLQLLDQKRKLLSQSLRDIKDDYVILLHTHMTNIVNAAGALADPSKDQMHNVPSTIKVQGAEGDVFDQQFEAFDTKYGKNSGREEELFSDLKELFANSNLQVQITSDQRLFLDRCETFLQKKCQSVEQFLSLQKKMIDQLNSQIASCARLNKEATSVQKSVFKSNGTQDFKKRMCKYFGQSTSNIAEMCFIIIDVPRRRLDKVAKNLQSHDQKLKRILQSKEEEYKKFRKKMAQILAEHDSASKGVEKNIVSVSQYKNNIQKTFSLFKNKYEQFVKNEQKEDQLFESSLQNITLFLIRQCRHSMMSYTLNKEKQAFLYKIYKNFNSDSEIIEIAKEDSRYQVLFNDPLKPNLYTQFKSQIKKKTFQETKKMLQKKEYQSRGIVGEREVGCCGIQKSKIEKFTKLKSHNARLCLDYNNQKFKDGQLQILNKGLRFQQKRKNPFGEKIQIIVPTKEIISFSHKTFPEGQNGVQILTNMGSILLLSDQYHEIQESLQKNLGTKLALRDQNQSKLQKSSDSSSFMKQNNASTEYKVSFEKSLISPELKSNLNKLNKPGGNADVVAFKKIIENWKKNKLFSDAFVIQSSQESATSGSIRADYKFQDDLNKFLLKQKRSVKTLNPSQNLLVLIYQWKVSFPDMPMLKSFAHSEEIKIELAQDVVKVAITEANRGESHLFVRKTFYNEIPPMNEKLVKLIVEACQRQAHVIKSEEPQSQESTILLDMENLALDKEEINNHNNRLVKKMSSGNLGLQSQKGGADLKDSRGIDMK